MPTIAGDLENRLRKASNLYNVALGLGDNKLREQYLDNMIVHLEEAKTQFIALEKASPTHPQLQEFKHDLNALIKMAENLDADIRMQNAETSITAAMAMLKQNPDQKTNKQASELLKKAAEGIARLDKRDLYSGKKEEWENLKKIIGEQSARCSQRKNEWGDFKNKVAPLDKKEDLIAQALAREKLRTAKEANTTVSEVKSWLVAAKESYESAKNSTNAQEKRRYIEQVIGRLGKADEYLRALKETNPKHPAFNKLDDQYKGIQQMTETLLTPTNTLKK